MEEINKEETKDGQVGEPSQDVKPENAVPYGRFQEVNQKLREKEKEIEKLKKMNEESENQKLKEKEKYKELYEKVSKEKEELEGLKKQYEFQNKIYAVLKSFDFEIPDPYLKMINYTEDDEELKIQIQKIKEQFENDIKKLKKGTVGSQTNPPTEPQVSKTPPRIQDYKSIEKWKVDYEEWRKKTLE